MNVPISNLISGPGVEVWEHTEWQVRKGGQLHPGVDIPAPLQTKITSPGNNGKLVKKKTQRDKDGNITGAGHYVEIEYPTSGVRLVLMHLHRLPSTKLGHIFEAGDTIAYSGNTGHSHGPHLHLETYKGGKRVRPSTIFNFKT